MTSIWKVDGIAVYVDQYNETKQPSIAELNPIGSQNSIYHWIYTPDETIDLEGTVVGSGRIGLLKSKVGNVVTLTTDLGNITVLFRELKFQRQQVYCQLIDTSLPVTAPVYRVSMLMRL